ncbi:hypothetical protein RFI_02282 [Reticulomyxa filosa]|uniref:Uncharacterized protein n=1 Tax=Reticulomyxa filosa TaxID=46433 RepID=X6P8C7_RETFI|nr:hypothetical protein RFI_02282 [Reticulomyxa filosa]|eukprot:ETO34805.1 hypothetical protein RFI_02282 [Reticulomyxa filosa]
MGNQNTTSFQILKDLPTSLSESQCVLHKHELLLCGGANKRTCYSYHTLKNEYKFICKYPRDVELNGHCVMKLVDNDNEDSNQIILLSFGGYPKHTLTMKYVSIWDNMSNKSNDSNNFNEWIHQFIIERNKYHYYGGLRAVIGGRNNNLLFITYPNYICV